MKQDLSAVPGRAHYSRNYIRDGRLFSYAHQLRAVLGFEPATVLEVGVGAGVVTAALRAMGVDVTTMDVQPELTPDCVASVTALPLRDKQYDAAVCCQVLEHLPFDAFGAALKELRRITRKGLVVSLPDATPHYEVRLVLPKLPKISWSGTRAKDPGADWKSRKWEANGHYWEIGYEGCNLRTVRNAMVNSGWQIPKTWRVPEMPYHRFFELHPMSAASNGTHR